MVSYVMVVQRNVDVHMCYMYYGLCNTTSNDTLCQGNHNHSNCWMPTDHVIEQEVNSDYTQRLTR